MMPGQLGPEVVSAVDRLRDTIAAKSIDVHDACTQLNGAMLRLKESFDALIQEAQGDLEGMIAKSREEKRKAAATARLAYDPEIPAIQSKPVPPPPPHVAPVKAKGAK